MAEPSFTNELTPRGSTPPAPSEQTVSLDSPQGGSANRDAKKPPAFLGLTVPWLALGVLTLLGGGALGKLILIDPPTSPARVSVISPQNLPAASSSEPKKTFLFPKGVPAEFSSPPQSSRPELGAGGTTPPAAAVAAASLSLFTPQEMDECLHQVGFNGSSTPTTGRPGALRGRRLGLLSGARAQKCLLLVTSFLTYVYQAISLPLGKWIGTDGSDNEIFRKWIGTDGIDNKIFRYREGTHVAISIIAKDNTIATTFEGTCQTAVKCVSSPLTTMAGYVCKVLPPGMPNVIEYCISVGNTCGWTKETDGEFKIMKVPCDIIVSLYMKTFEEVLKMLYPSPDSVVFNGTDNIVSASMHTSFTAVYDYNEGNNVSSSLKEYVIPIASLNILHSLVYAAVVVAGWALIVWLFKHFPRKKK
eukprot:GHVT01062499.1.p1 GENE.GHVT01062499.1~~GHVT01062499.1.p1  ORF type:complete len:453 (-),score=41.90 GHVT01062499.1:866-2116(-)